MNQNNLLTDIDLFSLDIDGIDYWILKKLPKNFSKIAIIEYNPLFGKDLEITVPNIDNLIEQIITTQIYVLACQLKLL